MKSHEHPEFFIFHKLAQLEQHFPEDEKIKEVMSDVKKILNENTYSIAQYSVLYTCFGDGELYPETRERLKDLYSNALKVLDQGDSEQ